MQNPGFHLDGKARMHGTFTSGKSVISFCGLSQYPWAFLPRIPPVWGKCASRDYTKRCCFHFIVNKIVRIFIYAINYCYFGCKMGYNLSFVVFI